MVTALCVFFGMFAIAYLINVAGVKNQRAQKAAGRPLTRAQEPWLQPKSAQENRSVQDDIEQEQRHAKIRRDFEVDKIEADRVRRVAEIRQIVRTELAEIFPEKIPAGNYLGYILRGELTPRPLNGVDEERATEIH